jgi:dihydroneopterin aldolase
MRRPVWIELELGCDLRRAGRSDRLVHTIDYAEIYRAVREVAAEREHRLVEALAERIAEALLSRFPLESCTVSVRKPTPVAGNLRHAGVRIHRSKGADAKPG